MNYQNEIDLSQTDPAIQQEYAELETKIENWLAEHPGDLTDAEHAELQSMLSQRAEIMSRLLKSSVYTAF